MESAMIVDATNQPIVDAPVTFGRIPIAGDWLRVDNQILQVTAVLFNVTPGGTSAIVKAVPHSM
jgi:hypothetical protein